MTPKRTSGELRLARAYIERHPAEAARHLDAAPPDELATVLEEESAARRTQVIRHLSGETASEVVRLLGDEATRQLLRSLDPSRAAALLARLEPEVQEANLALLEPGLRAELRELMSYPPDSAGALMDPRVLGFARGTQVREVLRRLRALRRRRVQDLFVVDDEGALLGTVPLQRVVLAASGDHLDQLVDEPPAAVQALAPRDEIMELLSAHRASSLPVVDFEGRLLGVLRQDELIATAQQDATTDMVTMVGAGKDERALSTPWFAVRKRLPWLEINLLTAFLAASVVGVFEDTIARFTALAVLLPVVAGQSGNTGAQALAVTMRGLALREIRLRHWLRVTSKELLAGCLNGVAVAVTTAGAVYVWSRSTGLAMVIGVSMIISMTAAGLAGATIPLILTRLRQDPAQSSSIILTTVTDVVGFFSFLGIATLLASKL
ncbi:MAG: magnesium transporter [Candidatus Eiseniibacteriota bacterium]|jgi:magnesium transporter